MRNGVQRPQRGLEVTDEPEGTEVLRERYSGLLGRAAAITERIGRTAIRANTCLERYRGGWSLWDALDLEMNPSNPSAECTHVGIEMALRRMPFVLGVHVDRPLEVGSGGWITVRVLLKPLWRRFAAQFCEIEIRRAVAQRQVVGVNLKVEVE